jgi:hypothetical protein
VVVTANLARRLNLDDTDRGEAAEHIMDEFRRLNVIVNIDYTVTIPDDEYGSVTSRASDLAATLTADELTQTVQQQIAIAKGDEYVVTVASIEPASFNGFKIVMATNSSTDSPTWNASGTTRVISGRFFMTVPGASFVSDTLALGAVTDALADELSLSAFYVRIQAGSIYIDPATVDVAVAIDYIATIPGIESKFVTTTAYEKAVALTPETLTTAVQAKMSVRKGPDYVVVVTAVEPPLLDGIDLTANTSNSTAAPDKISVTSATLSPCPSTVTASALFMLSYITCAAFLNGA